MSAELDELRQAVVTLSECVRELIDEAASQTATLEWIKGVLVNETANHSAGLEWIKDKLLQLARAEGLPDSFGDPPGWDRESLHALLCRIEATARFDTSAAGLRVRAELDELLGITGRVD